MACPLLLSRPKEGGRAVTARKILIIEDDPSIRECYGRLFLREGFDPRLESCAISVERKLEEYRDVVAVVLDYRMPGVNGLDLLRRLRLRNFTAAVVMVTAYATQEMIQDARQLGVLRVLSKPVNVSQLLQAVEESIRSEAAVPGGRRKEADGLTGYPQPGERVQKDN
jgi:DNA-binding NtrC family response regulator